MTLQQWKWGIIAAAVLAIITSLPQLYLCYERGRDWNGAYTYFDTDEFAYSAYANALIDGRPRRNDPYTGNDDGQFETLFSIQFIPAYSIAIPARIFGVSASSTFIILLPVITIASTLILFLFLFELTQNSVLSAIGAIGVLCFGALAAQTPWGLFTVPIAIPFPFLRRYMPAFPFPFFFAMALFVWRSLTKNSLLWSVLAGLSFIVLVYSYFFLWTAAAAWLAILMVLWATARPGDYWLLLRVFGVIALVGAIALVPYLWLLTHRAPIIDQSQLLEFTHRPDLLRGPVLYGIAIIVIIIITIRLATRDVNWRDPRILFVLSFALAAILIFNQQVLTGRSLQPFHYERFIANYWVLCALFLTFGLAARSLPKRVPLHLAIGSLAIGLILVVHDTKDRFANNVELDKRRLVALKLKGHQGVAFVSSPLTETLATTASNPVLWAQYLYTFSYEDLRGQRLRFYKYLYYSGVTEQNLRVSLEPEGYSVRGAWMLKVSRISIFGVGRTNPTLTVSPRPISPQEIEEAVDEYRMFSSNFSGAEAATPLLSYAIVSAADNLSNLDKWYERDAGEKVGDFIIYRLKLK
jgi:hypothetical protein